MKTILIALLMAGPLMAQEVSVPPPVTTQTIGGTVVFTHSLLPQLPDGVVMFHASTEAELGTISEKEIGLANLNLFQGPTPNDFKYLASANPDLNNKSVCLQLASYMVIGTERVESIRTPVVCGMIMEKLEAPKSLAIQ